MIHTKLILGVDSGSTKTICAIANEKGKVLGLGSAGSSSHYATSVEEAKENFRVAVRKAIASARLNNVVFDVGCFGMTGLDTKSDYERIPSFITSLNIAKKCVIVIDAVIAHYAITNGEPGIVVIAGTGSIAYGVNGRGEVAQSSGREWLVSDEGSAYDIAKKGLTAIIRAYDGRGTNTLLTEMFKKQFGVSTFGGILQKIYEDTRKSTIATLAPVITSAARRGDVVASNILKEAGKELGLAAVAVAKRLNMEKERITVGCIGGVFKAGKFILKPFKKTVKIHLPKAIFKPPLHDATIGAIILGLKEGGVPITRKLVSEIKHNLKLKSSQGYTSRKLG